MRAVESAPSTTKLAAETEMRAMASVDRVEAKAGAARVGEGDPEAVKGGVEMEAVEVIEGEADEEEVMDGEADTVEVMEEDADADTVLVGEEVALKTVKYGSAA
jgi:hypothetical protein